MATLMTNDGPTRTPAMAMIAMKGLANTESIPPARHMCTAKITHSPMVSSALPTLTLLRASYGNSYEQEDHQYESRQRRTRLSDKDEDRAE